MNTSATGGYLPPIGPEPLEDDLLEDFVQAVFVAITGIDSKMVRPRWQPEPPLLPPFNTSWLAFGISATRPDTFAFEEHDPDADGGNGVTTVIRHEEVDFLLSFYGPSPMRYGNRLRDGLAVSQNREVLHSAGLELVAVSGAFGTGELIKERWLPRADMTVTVRREIGRTYSVQNIISAHGTINTDGRILNFSA